MTKHRFLARSDLRDGAYVISWQYKLKSLRSAVATRSNETPSGLLPWRFSLVLIHGQIKKDQYQSGL